MARDRTPSGGMTVADGSGRRCREEQRRPAEMGAADGGSGRGAARDYDQSSQIGIPVMV